MQTCSLSWNTLKKTYQTCMTMWVNVMCVQFWYAHVYALIHMCLMTMWKTRNSLYALTVRPESFRVRGPHPQHLTHCELSMTAMWNKWDSLKIISSNTMRFTYCEYANIPPREVNDIDLHHCVSEDRRVPPRHTLRNPSRAITHAQASVCVRKHLSREKPLLKRYET